MFERGATKTTAYLLLGTGTLLLLANAGVLGVLPAFLWASLLFGLGAAFWLGSAGRLPAWQRLAGFAAIGVFAIVTSGRFSGVAALGFPAMAFGLVYLNSPKNWWALLPAGVLGSVGLLVTFESLFPRWDATPVLFLGFAGTFTLLYLLSPRRGGKRWALYPAILFIILTVVTNDPGGSTPGWLLPLFLIGGGAFMLWRWRRSR